VNWETTFREDREDHEEQQIVVVEPSSASCPDRVNACQWMPPE
jgi:hypothetical protein